jgi:hypothetical protein
MTVLARTCPDWRSKVIHESSPILQGVTRFNDRTRGILGEFTEVVTCRKR